VKASNAPISERSHASEYIQSRPRQCWPVPRVKSVWAVSAPSPAAHGIFVRTFAEFAAQASPAERHRESPNLSRRRSAAANVCFPAFMLFFADQGELAHRPQTRMTRGLRADERRKPLFHSGETRRESHQIIRWSSCRGARHRMSSRYRRKIGVAQLELDRACFEPCSRKRRPTISHSRASVGIYLRQVRISSETYARD